MCQFFSCIVMKDKRVLYLPGSHNHHEILEHFQIPDEQEDPSLLAFARVEIIPPPPGYFASLSEWKLRIDERVVPEWFSPAHQDSAFAALGDYLTQHRFENQKGLVFRNKKGLILRNCEINELSGDTQVLYLDSSTVQDMWDASTVQNMRGSSVALKRLGNVVIVRAAKPVKEDLR